MANHWYCRFDSETQKLISLLTAIHFTQFFSFQPAKQVPVTLSSVQGAQVLSNVNKPTTVLFTTSPQTQIQTQAVNKVKTSPRQVWNFIWKSDLKSQFYFLYIQLPPVVHPRMIISDFPQPHFEPDMLPDYTRKPGISKWKSTLFFFSKLKCSLLQNASHHTMWLKSAIGFQSMTKLESSRTLLQLVTPR